MLDNNLHKGTPRETFIRKYLEGYLSVSVAIGTGEIIDAFSQPEAPRNQYDIVIYKGIILVWICMGGISGFLIESVIATIEVKSLLDQKAIDQAVGAAFNAKQLTPNIVKSFNAGWMPSKVLNYVVAYSGLATMSTAHKWIVNSHSTLNIPLPAWTQQNKLKTAGTALDGVFVLNTGFVMLDNTPNSYSFNKQQINGTHIISDSVDGNILMFFLCL